MRSKGIRGVLPFLGLVLLVALIVYGCIALSYSSYYGTRPLQAEESEYAYYYPNRWQIHLGDKADGTAGWQPFDENAQKRLSRYEGTLWLRRTLPPLASRDPYFFLAGFQRFEVFVDGRPAYSFNLDGRQGRLQAFSPLYPIRLQPEDAGKVLEIRAIWNESYLPIGWSTIGGRYHLLLNVLGTEWPLLLYSVLLTGTGLIAVALFLRRRKESLYLWFALLSLSAGFGLLGKMTLLQWLFEVNAFYYWKDLLLAVAIYAFIGFYGAALRLSGGWIYRTMNGIMLLYTLLAAAAGWRDPVLFWRLLVDWLPYCCIPVLIVVSVSLVRQYRKHPRSETVWLMRGYGVLLLTGLIYILLNFSPVLLESVMRLSPHMSLVIYHELPAGLLLFMLCLAMVIVHRFMEVYRQVERHTALLAAKNEELERFQSSLENQVRLRTQELEEANRSLAATMREKAETLAEVSVLEERNRIAHEIHDVVGHTLTAAIVQLEASKKLAGRDLAKAAEKLDTINGLVRKGLDDIRRSVRLLKDEGEPIELHAALNDLIRETEATMGVRIETDIEPIEDLGSLTQRVLYHALQEGLTNGIRHGNSRRFAFSLRREGPWIRFVLDNDGAPFGDAKLGFGLTAMMERVQLLGGAVEIGPTAGAGVEGGPGYGCRLAIQLPYTASLE